MHVQVEEAGHHELVAQVDDCSVRRQAECAGLGEAGADLPDLAVGDDDRRVRDWLPAGNGEQLPGMNDGIGAGRRSSLRRDCTPIAAAAAAPNNCDLRIV